MGKAARTLAMAGMALVAGATIGTSPAAAATQSASGATVRQSAAQQTDQSRDRVVGYYRTLRRCEMAGWIGERHGRWDEYDCSRVRRGFRWGSWALEAQWDRRGNGGNHGGDNHGRDNDGHDNGRDNGGRDNGRDNDGHDNGRDNDGHDNGRDNGGRDNGRDNGGRGNR